MADMTRSANAETKYTGSLTADGNLDFPLKRGNQWARSVTADIRSDFGGGTVTAKVTGDGTNFDNATDSAGTAITWTTSAVKQVLTEGFGPYEKGRLALAGSTNPTLTATVTVRWE